MSLKNQLPWRAGACEMGQHAPEVDRAGQLSWRGINHPLGTRQLSPALQSWDPGQGPEQEGEAVGGSGLWAENGGGGEEAWLGQMLERQLKDWACFCTHKTSESTCAACFARLSWGLIRTLGVNGCCELVELLASVKGYCAHPHYFSMRATSADC